MAEKPDGDGDAFALRRAKFGVYCTKRHSFGTFQVDLGNIAFWLWCVSLRST